jgi:DNA-binding CsgD family transcriptional regulator
MTGSELLRFTQVRDACRLIGECRDLGSDPALWHRRMLDGLCQLIGAKAAAAGEGLWVRSHGPVKPLSAFEFGHDSRGRKTFRAHMREQGPVADPILPTLQQVPGRLVTHTRRQLVSDAAHHRSCLFNEYLRLADAGHRLMSVYQVSDDGHISAIALRRAVGERDFSAREQQLLTFFHGELGPLIGRSLVSATERSPEELSPRLRQTLACLLEGDSEKQVAARLGLSLATTHQYVTALYRHFRVQSRAELLAHAIKRIGQGQWRRLTSESAQPPLVPASGGQAGWSARATSMGNGSRVPGNGRVKVAASPGPRDWP